MENIHATAVDFDGAGILIVGKSCSGKSDLALRLIENRSAVLISDDRTDLKIENDQLMACCPKNIEGLLEVRGVGIIEQKFIKQSIVRLVVMAAEPSEIERLPRPTFFENQGISVPSIKLCLLEASAADKVVVKLKSVLEETKQNTYDNL